MGNAMVAIVAVLLVLPVGVLPVGVLPVGVLPVGVLPVGGLPVGGLPVGGLPVGVRTVDGLLVGWLPTPTVAVDAVGASSPLLAPPPQAAMDNTNTSAGRPAVQRRQVVFGRAAVREFFKIRRNKCIKVPTTLYAIHVMFSNVKVSRLQCKSV